MIPEMIIGKMIGGVEDIKSIANKEYFSINISTAFMKSKGYIIKPKADKNHNILPTQFKNTDRNRGIITINVQSTML